MTWLFYKDACHDKLANVEESTRPLAKGKNQGFVRTVNEKIERHTYIKYDEKFWNKPKKRPAQNTLRTGLLANS